MHRISFKYRDAKGEEVARKFITKRHKRFLITLKDGVNFIITSADNKTNGWVQNQIPGEPVHPEEFIQAVGSGWKGRG